MLKSIKEFFLGTPKPVEVQVSEKVEAANAQPIVKEAPAPAPVTAPAPAVQAQPAKPQATKKPRQPKPSGAPKARKPRVQK